MTETESTDTENENEEEEESEIRVPEQMTMDLIERGGEIRMTVPAAVVNAYELTSGDRVGFHAALKDGVIALRFVFNPAEDGINVRPLNYNPTTKRFDMRFPKPLSRFLRLDRHVRQNSEVNAVLEVTEENEDASGELVPTIETTIKTTTDDDEKDIHHIWPTLMGAPYDKVETMDSLMGPYNKRTTEVGEDYAGDSDRDEITNQYRMPVNTDLVTGYNLTETIEAHLKPVAYEGELAVGVFFGEPPEDGGDYVTRTLHKNSRFGQYAVGIPAAVVEAIGHDEPDLTIEKVPLRDGILLTRA